MGLVISKGLTLRKGYIPLDASYSNVSLLLHGDGTNGSTTIVDSSPSPKTVTAVGNAQISTAQSKFGGASILVGNPSSSTGSFLSVDSSDDLILGNTWTVELWWYLLTAGTGSDRNAVLGTSSLGSEGNLGIYQESVTPYINVRAGAAGSDVRSSNNSVVANQWQFIAVSCLNNVATIYINGIQDGTGPINGPVTVPVESIGRVGASFSAYDTNGYIDDLRITKGVARYTANFTPPTAPFPDRTDG
jgi:hypothetical protein